MDIVHPSLTRRAVRTFREQGVGAAVRRVGPVMGRFARAARAKAWRHRRPTLTALLLASEDADLDAQLTKALANRTRAWNRWLAEIIVIARGTRSLDELAPFVRGVPIRYYNVSDPRPAVVANTAVALANTEACFFLDDSSRPVTSAQLFMAGTAARSGVDVLCFAEDVPQDAAAMAPFLRSFDTLTLFCFRRWPLINTGLFRPEDGSDHLRGALELIWRRGYVFAGIRPSDPARIMHLPRAPIVADVSADVDRPPRVVYFVNGTDVRGGIRIVFEHCNRLRERGVEAMIASFAEPIQTWFPGLTAPLVAARDTPTTDVAVATFFTTAEFVAKLNCERFYFIQHDESLFAQDEDWTRAVRETYRLPIEFITISSWLVDLIRRESGKEALLVPNGINKEMFYPDPAYPRGPKVRVLVEGNRDIFWKGMEEAEKVLAGLDVEVWTLGNTGLDGDRNFVDAPQDELRRIYSSCDILLKTSWYEGMPLPHMEAMACGCALLTTDVPGVHDYCVEGWNCLMAPPRNVPAIRERLLELIADADLRSKLVANGLHTAEESFGWDKIIDDLARQYTHAAAQARAKFEAQVRLTVTAGRRPRRRATR